MSRIVMLWGNWVISSKNTFLQVTEECEQDMAVFPVRRCNSTPSLPVNEPEAVQQASSRSEEKVENASPMIADGAMDIASQANHPEQVHEALPVGTSGDAQGRLKRMCHNKRIRYREFVSAAERKIRKNPNIDVGSMSVPHFITAYAALYERLIRDLQEVQRTAQMSLVAEEQSTSTPTGGSSSTSPTSPSMAMTHHPSGTSSQPSRVQCQGTYVDARFGVMPTRTGAERKAQGSRLAMGLRDAAW